MKMAIVVVLGLAAGAASAQQERLVQIRSIDFQAGIVELFNFGSGDVDLSRWRFCTHDFNEQLRYSGANGLNGNTIEAGTSFFIHFNNDAPAGDPDRINRSAVGTFATPLDQDAFGMQLFFPNESGNISFGTSSQIADHIQWNIDGEGVGTAERRTNQAVGQGLWSAIGDFIVTQGDSLRIVLTDESGDEAGSPGEYEVINPDPDVCLPDLNNDGNLTGSDFNAWLSAFSAGDLRADQNGDNNLTGADFNAFLGNFSAGCD